MKIVYYVDKIMTYLMKKISFKSLRLIFFDYYNLTNWLKWLNIQSRQHIILKNIYIFILLCNLWFFYFDVIVRRVNENSCTTFSINFDILK